MCFKYNWGLKHSMKNTDFSIKDQGFHSAVMETEMNNWSELASWGIC